jgi:hypothetical protein
MFRDKILFPSSGLNSKCRSSKQLANILFQAAEFMALGLNIIRQDDF